MKLKIKTVSQAKFKETPPLKSRSKTGQYNQKETKIDNRQKGLLIAV